MCGRRPAWSPAQTLVRKAHCARRKRSRGNKGPRLTGPGLDFGLVPDQYSRRGYAKRLAELCREHWPDLCLTEDISPTGEALAAALMRE